MESTFRCNKIFFLFFLSTLPFISCRSHRCHSTHPYNALLCASRYQTIIIIHDHRQPDSFPWKKFQIYSNKCYLVISIS